MTSRDSVSIFVTGARDGVTRVVRRLLVTSLALVMASLMMIVWTYFKTQSDAARSERLPILVEFVNHSPGSRSIRG